MRRYASQIAAAALGTLSGNITRLPQWYLKWPNRRQYPKRRNAMTRSMLVAVAVGASVCVTTTVATLTSPPAIAHACPSGYIHTKNGWGSYHGTCKRPSITSQTGVQPKRHKGLRHR
jgi:hypothetical protein